MRDEEAEVGEERVAQEVPLERAVEEPDAGVLREDACSKVRYSANIICTFL